MIRIPVLRWGESYESMETDKVVHFATGEALAEVSRANGGLVERDMRHARRAREVLREIPIKELLNLIKRSEEHTSELQSRQYLVCRLLLEKKNNNNHANRSH